MSYQSILLINKDILYKITKYITCFEMENKIYNIINNLYEGPLIYNRDSFYKKCFCSISQIMNHHKFNDFYIIIKYNNEFIDVIDINGEYYCGMTIGYGVNKFNDKTFYVGTFNYGTDKKKLSLELCWDTMEYILNGKFIDYDDKNNKQKIKKINQAYNNFLIINKIYPIIYKIIKEHNWENFKITLCKKSDLPYNKDLANVVDNFFI